jgi:hypothetical protein
MLQHLHIWQNSTVENMQHDILHSRTTSTITNVKVGDDPEAAQITKVVVKANLNLKVEVAGHAKSTSNMPTHSSWEGGGIYIYIYIYKFLVHHINMTYQAHPISFTNITELMYITLKNA